MLRSVSDSVLCVWHVSGVGYTMRDIRYHWKDGLSSVGMSNEVQLPQFRVLGHRQRATVVTLTTGNQSQRLLSQHCSIAPPPTPSPSARVQTIDTATLAHTLNLTQQSHDKTREFGSRLPRSNPDRVSTRVAKPIAMGLGLFHLCIRCAQSATP
ncbi:uncharacterized protein LOC113227446 [Hyposmocoma kahamanoa]|uniref:uncharacterized protein LOC113227446 n=1 Tax=Hyposmocoma kahamanoa TaxID=1477025 RepID=UPI000E6DA4D8|nr:uncharacterized protein LOC113227446 [Hyposmocoma kahamanoa]